MSSILLAKARDYGARIVFINLGAKAHGYLPGDLYLEHRFEEAMPAIARLLDCPPEPKSARKDPAAGETGEIARGALPAADEDGTPAAY